MDPETSKIVVIAVTSVGALVWLAGLTVVLRAYRDLKQSALRASERFEVNDAAEPGTIVGEAEVEGQPEELSAKLAGQLARESAGPFGPVKIVARDRHEVTFEPAGKSQLGFKKGRIRLEPAGSRTRIEYAIETSTSGILIGGWVVLALGLVVIIGVPWLMFTLVIPSPNPSVRGQAFQTFQMVHFLWPPFLFAFLSRQPGRMFRARMDALVHNLPYS